MTLRWLPALPLLCGCHLLVGHNPTDGGQRPPEATPGDARVEGPRSDGTAPAGCGDGVAGGNEACDGPDLRGQSCASLGLLAGELRCTPACGLDYSGCKSCGDGALQGAEVCDGPALGGRSCQSLGFAGGALACKGCRLDASGCTLPAQRGRLVYGTATEAVLRLIDTATEPPSFGPELKLPLIGATRWIVNRLSPTDPRDEVAAVLAETPSDLRLHLLHLGGEGWTVDEVVAIPVLALDRGARVFDLVYERVSGEALLVYSDESATPRYRSYRKDTGWSPPAAVFAPGKTPGTSPVRHVTLATRPGSDEVALLYSDAGTNVFRALWSGSSFLSWSQEDHSFTSEPTTHPYPSFAVAFEGVSRELLETVGSSCCSCFGFCTGEATKPAQLGCTTTSGGACTTGWSLMRLVPREGSNEVLLVGDERYATVWTGSSWKAAYRMSPPNAPSSTVWWSDGAWSLSPAAAIVVHRGWTDVPVLPDGRGKLFWGRYLPAVSPSWSTGTPFTVKGMGELSWPQVEPLTTGVIAIVSDDLGQLWAVTSDTTSWKLTAGNPVGVGLASAVTRAFSLDLRR